MKQPPDDDRGRQDQHSEYLVAPEEPQLFSAPFSLGDLLKVRLDSGFCHFLWTLKAGGLPVLSQV
jgi:hypothetical protein